MADNYKISSKYRQDENKNEEKNNWSIDSAIWSFLRDTVNPAVDALMWDKSWHIDKAIEIQDRINSINDEIYNTKGLNSDEIKNRKDEVANLTKQRDDFLSWKSWGWWDSWILSMDPISNEDIYKRINWADGGSKLEYETLVDQNKNKKMASFMNDVVDARNTAWYIKAMNTYQDRISNWESLFDILWEANKTDGKWFEGFVQDFITDVKANITPKDFRLWDDENWTYRNFYENDADMIIDKFVRNNDVIKALQAQYNFIKEYEELEESDREADKKVAENMSDTYRTIVKDFNNLKKDVAYMYEKYWEYDGNISDIEYDFALNNWRTRRMFETSDSREKQLAEDYAVSALKTMEVEKYWYRTVESWINEEYPITWKYIWNRLGNWISTAFFWVSKWFNYVNKILQWASNTISTLSTAAYNRVMVDNMTWSDAIDAADSVTYWAVSMDSLRNDIINTTAPFTEFMLALSDAWPSIWTEAATIALTEWMIKAMWVVEDAEIIADIAKAWREGSKFARYTSWNEWLLQFSTKEILAAKVREFAGRWIVQNTIISAWADAISPENYWKVDLALDLGFSMLDVYTLVKWVSFWAEKMTNEARKSRWRNTIRDSLGITDDQWMKIITDPQWVMYLDALAESFQKEFKNWVEALAKEKWVDVDDVLWEMIDFTRKSFESPDKMLPYYVWAKVQVESALTALSNKALAKSVALEWSWKLSPDILKKIWTREITHIDWSKWIEYFWESELTVEEFKEIYKQWLWLFNWLLNWRSKIFKELMDNELITYESKKWLDMKALRDIDKIDLTTKEWRIWFLKLTAQWNKEYLSTLLKAVAWGNREVAENFRVWEYNKYWKTNWFQYWDIWYTYLMHENPQEELKKRLREFASEIDDDLKWWDILEKDLWNNSATIKISESITWKKTFVWLSFEEACKQNPALEAAGEWFYRRVMINPSLEVYEKDTILWNASNEPKELFDISPDFTNAKQLFWSSYETEFFIWRIWWSWTMRIVKSWWSVVPEEDVKYFVLYDNKDKLYRIVSKDYEFKVIDWKMVLYRDHKKIYKDWRWSPKSVVMKLTPDEREFSWMFDLYGKEWKKYIKSIVERWYSVAPQERTFLSKVSKLEAALTKWSNSYQWKKYSWNRWHQWEGSEELFKNDWSLLSAKKTTWYLDICDTFNVPFSFYMEVARMIKRWKITEKEWAIMILMSSSSNIVEHKWFFAIWPNSKITKDLQSTLFHAEGVITIPWIWSVNNWWNKTFVYKKVVGKDWVYELYELEWKELNWPVWTLWINTAADSWRTLIKFNNMEQPVVLENYYINKKFWIDVDNDKYTFFKAKRFKENEDKMLEDLKREIDTWALDVKIWVEELKDSIESKQQTFFRLLNDWKEWSKSMFNRDIKVDKKNIGNIQLLYALKESWWSESKINAWFRQSLLQNFIKEWMWVEDLKEALDLYEEMVKNWTIKDVNWIDMSTWNPLIIIDPSSQWFKLNYNEITYKKNKKKTQLIFNIDDKNIQWWRNMTIDFVWKHNLVEINWERYMSFDVKWKYTSKWDYTFYVKVDRSLKPTPYYEVNPLALSKENYKLFASKEGSVNRLLWDVEWKIFSSMNLFPARIREAIRRWANKEQVLNLLTDGIKTDKLMWWIASIRYWTDEITNLDSLLDIYNDAYSIRKSVINKLKIKWIDVSIDDVLEYYQYLFKDNLFDPDSVIDILDWAVTTRWSDHSNQIAEWLRNVVTLDRTWQRMTAKSYNYMQSRIIEMRLSKFVEDFNNWWFVYRDWRLLDLRDPADYALYVENVRSAYEYAISPVDPKEIRKEWILSKKMAVWNKQVEILKPNQYLLNYANLAELEPLLWEVSSKMFDAYPTMQKFSKSKFKQQKAWKRLNNIIWYKSWTFSDDDLLRLDWNFTKFIEWWSNASEFVLFVKKLEAKWYTQSQIAWAIIHNQLANSSIEDSFRKLSNLHRDYLKSADQYKWIVEWMRFKRDAERSIESLNDMLYWDEFLSLWWELWELAAKWNEDVLIIKEYMEDINRLKAAWLDTSEAIEKLNWVLDEYAEINWKIIEKVNWKIYSSEDVAKKVNEKNLTTLKDDVEISYINDWDVVAREWDEWSDIQVEILEDYKNRADVIKQKIDSNNKIIEEANFNILHKASREERDSATELRRLASEENQELWRQLNELRKDYNLKYWDEKIYLETKLNDLKDKRRFFERKIDKLTQSLEDSENWTYEEYLEKNIKIIEDIEYNENFRDAILWEIDEIERALDNYWYSNKIDYIEEHEEKLEFWTMPSGKRQYNKREYAKQWSLITAEDVWASESTNNTLQLTKVGNEENKVETTKIEVENNKIEEKTETVTDANVNETEGFTEVKEGWNDLVNEMYVEEWIEEEYHAYEEWEFVLPKDIIVENWWEKVVIYTVSNESIANCASMFNEAYNWFKYPVSWRLWEMLKSWTTIRTQVDRNALNFVKSWAWLEYVMYSLVKWLPIPSNLATHIKNIYWLDISKRNYKWAFNSLVWVVEDYYWIKFSINRNQEDWFVRILYKDWKSKTPELFKSNDPQLLKEYLSGDKYAHTYNIWDGVVIKDINWKDINLAEEYEKFKERYFKSYTWWINNWTRWMPMTWYEFYTLKMVDTANSDLYEFMFKNKKYRNIPLYTNRLVAKWVPDANIINDFYNKLYDKNNFESYKNSNKLTKKSLENNLSQYYRNKKAQFDKVNLNLDDTSNTILFIDWDSVKEYTKTIKWKKQIHYKIKDFDLNKNGFDQIVISWWSYYNNRRYATKYWANSYELSFNPEWTKSKWTSSWNFQWEIWLEKKPIDPANPWMWEITQDKKDNNLNGLVWWAVCDIN